MPQEPRNSIHVYLHLVWGTYLRYPLITPDKEDALFRCIEAESIRLGCNVLATGGMPDHVHLAVTLPTPLSMAKLMQQVKGVSSAFARDQLYEGEFFGWQEGYGAFSFSQTQCDKVINYIKNQKQHHEQKTLWPSVEITTPPSTSSPPSGTDG
ncbi:transposase [Capsulimonas corticalis]|uniref:Transposase n=1 Tax=Capsulimonas corticalis TaxID=2219043 RepID=A0A402D717_9BACT|nr:IS200/IS605 family transposase [Capsulimonas corticalis]BDI29750.1 transposase [Capsulimonas corticalis]